MKPSLRSLALSAMFLALGLVLPFLTGQIPEIGNLLLPMHLPVLLCGLVCGWKYGLAVGFTTPLLRSMLFGMPTFYPSAVSMAFELAAYGLVIGLVFMQLKKKNILSVYISLLASMLVGRAVWGIAMALLLIGGDGFTFAAFISGAFTTAFPGILLQLIIVPATVLALKRAKLVDFENKQ